jgi:hypothetical protein
VKKFPANGNAALEGQLRDALQARLARGASEAPQACLDPETLAAWVDGDLDARERAAAQAHAADCARCQALLAAMIRTSDPAAEGKSWWRWPALTWLAPLTAVATALVVWAIVPGRPRLQPSDQAVPAVSLPNQVPPSAAGRVSEPPAVARAPADEMKKRVPLAPSPTNAAGARSAAAASAPAPGLAESSAKALAAPSAQALSSQDAVEKPQAAVPPKAPQESFARALRREAPIVDVVSVDPGKRWRIVAGGAVQRSIDGGSTWETQETGVSVTLAAGASPLPSVCWLVGPGGIVLLQTDGRSWRRIAFPEPTDLASIRASDERTATVTTADGRMFSTADGGVTWTRSPRA